MRLMRDNMQLELRAGHPDHFMNMPLGPRAEVIENVGEDDIPWFIGLEFTQDAARFTTTWDDSYPEHLGAIIRNLDDVIIGSAMHEMKDAADGTHIRLTITLPEAAPEQLVRGHLEHFAVEFGNWTRMHALRGSDQASNRARQNSSIVRRPPEPLVGNVRWREGSDGGCTTHGRSEIERRDFASCRRRVVSHPLPRSLGRGGRGPQRADCHPLPDLVPTVERRSGHRSEVRQSRTGMVTVPDPSCSSTYTIRGGGNAVFVGVSPT